jgi:exosortase A
VSSVTESLRERQKLPLLMALLIGACFLYVYHEMFVWLYERYTNPDSHYSHGFLVPAISGYLVWRKRNELRQMHMTSSLGGLGLVVLALLVHLAGVMTHVFFVSGFSVFFLVVGLSLYFFGREVTRKVAFPLVFLLFMFPLPIGAITFFSFPLKLFVANIGSLLVKGFGIPLVREGAFVRLTNTSLSVGDPCSGIRSIIALMALGSLIAYFSPIGMTRKTVLFLSAVPVAIFTNVLRVSVLIVAASWLGGRWASPEHWFHTASGMGVFVISMVLLFMEMKVMEK